MHNEQPTEAGRPGAGEEDSEQAAWQNFVYPPPPSFYENLQVPSERIPLPRQPAAGTPDQQTLGSTLQEKSPLAAMQAPTLPPGPTYVGAPPARRSTRWVLILIAVVGSALLLSCGLCSWAFVSAANVTYERVTHASNTLDDFYHSIQKRDYSAAYTYLAPGRELNGLTLSDFTRKAQQREASYGAIRAYTQEQPTFGTDPAIGLDFSRVLIPVAVTRDKLSYTATLTLSKINGSWKIVNFDQI
jgi:hypothetical protein